MKNFLALIGLVVVLTAGAGWYFGWYKIGTEPAGEGHRKFEVDINTQKITDDLKTGTQKVGDLITPDSNTPPTESNLPSVTRNPNGGTTIVLPKLEIKTGN